MAAIRGTFDIQMEKGRGDWEKEVEIINRKSGIFCRVFLKVPLSPSFRENKPFLIHEGRFFGIKVLRFFSRKGMWNYFFPSPHPSLETWNLRFNTLKSPRKHYSPATKEVGGKNFSNNFVRSSARFLLYFS